MVVYCTVNLYRPTYEYIRLYVAASNTLCFSRFEIQFLLKWYSFSCFGPLGNSRASQGPCVCCSLISLCLSIYVEFTVYGLYQCWNVTTFTYTLSTVINANFACFHFILLYTHTQFRAKYCTFYCTIFISQQLSYISD